MTNRQLAMLVLKLMGVYCLILVAESVPAVSYWLASEGESLLPFALSTMVLLLFTALGISLIWKSERYVRLVLPRSDAADPEPGKSKPDDLQGVFFSVVGVVLVVHALPSIVSIIISYSLADKSPEFGSPPTLPWPSLAAVLVQVALGAALFLGGTGLARIWRRINEMNQAPKGAET